MTDEHERFACYLLKFANVGEADEAALVHSVLTDPDRVMAESAVVRHVDLRAAELLTGPGFPDWAGRLTPAVADHAFVARRLREWMLLRALTLGEPWQAEDLTSASDWLQRAASARLEARDALAVLAGQGRTHRVRAAAANRLAALERSDARA